MLAGESKNEIFSRYFEPPRICLRKDCNFSHVCNNCTSSFGFQNNIHWNEVKITDEQYFWLKSFEVKWSLVCCGKILNTKIFIEIKSGQLFERINYKRPEDILLIYFPCKSFIKRYDILSKLHQTSKLLCLPLL